MKQEGPGKSIKRKNAIYHLCHKKSALLMAPLLHGYVTFKGIVVELIYLDYSCTLIWLFWREYSLQLF